MLVIVDGLRADMVTPGLTPALCAVGEAGCVFDGHRSVFPSATRVNSASIATGCYPAAHGLAGNAIALDEGAGLAPISVGTPEFRDRWRRATGRTLHRPTLAQRLRAHGGAVIYSNSSAGAAHMQDPDGHGTLYHRSGSFGPGLVPLPPAQSLDVGYDAEGDAATTDRFCAALAAGGDTALFVLWICEPDHSQHTLELGSPAHHAVIAGSDRCVARVLDTVASLRGRGEDVLLVVGSDHGHESVDEIIPVVDLMVEAGLKRSSDSSDVVVASSGMSGLVYLSPEALGRGGDIAAWLRAQSWTGEVYVGDALGEVNLPRAPGLQIAFTLAKRDEPNRYGVRGLGHVLSDPFTRSDHAGHGQHGGLGPYETRPFLIVNGGRFEPGRTTQPSSTVDIAPTIMEFLGLPATGMDGRPLPSRR